MIDAVEQLKGIAAVLSELWRCEVTVRQVRRAIRRARDPLPACRPLGRVVAVRAELVAWAARQPGAVAPVTAGAKVTLAR